MLVDLLTLNNSKKFHLIVNNNNNISNTDFIEFLAADGSLLIVAVPIFLDWP